MRIFEVDCREVADGWCYTINECGKTTAPFNGITRICYSGEQGVATRVFDVLSNAKVISEDFTVSFTFKKRSKSV